MSPEPTPGAGPSRSAGGVRAPNSYTGIFWVLGRFDRGWPERAVYGKVRSMSSESTRRKLRLHDYLARWSPPHAP